MIEQAVVVTRDVQAQRLRRRQGDPGLPAVDTVTMGAGNIGILISRIADLATIALDDEPLTSYILPGDALEDGQPRCPACGRLSANHPAIRHGSKTVTDAEGEAVTIGLIGVGFRCPRCGHQWGFGELGDG